MSVPAIRVGKEGGVIRAGLILPVISLPLFEIIISVDSSETSDAHDRDADDKRSFIMTPSPTSHHQEPTTYRRSDEFNLGAHSGLASQALTI